MCPERTFEYWLPDQGSNRDLRIRNPLLVSGAPRELPGWHSDRWFQAKRPRSTRIAPIIEGKQLAACATRGKMERIGKIDALPAVA